MRYTVDDFLKQVFKRCGLVLEGWPTDIPFCNLSNVGGMKNLERLRHVWVQGEMRFVPVTDQHKAAAEADPLSVVPGCLNRGFRKRAQRSDIGERHYRPVTGAGYLPQPRLKSQVVVTPEMEAEVDAEVHRAMCLKRKRWQSYGTELSDDPIEEFTSDEEEELTPIVAARSMERAWRRPQWTVAAKRRRLDLQLSGLN